MKSKKKLLAMLLLVAAAGVSTCAFAACSGNGNSGDTDINEPDVPLGPGVVCAHSNISHETAKSATCTSDGNAEYWYCGDCKEYFSDAEYKNKTTLAAVTVKGGHKYGDFIYDYTDKIYKKVCETDANHIAEQEAGVEGYPYLVRNAKELNSVALDGCHIKLEADITVPDGEYIDIGYSDKVGTFVIDLNSHKIESESDTAIYIYDASDVTIKNGSVITKGVYENFSCGIVLTDNNEQYAPKLKMVDVTVDTTVQGAYSYALCVDPGSVAVLENCVINSGYVGIDAEGKLVQIIDCDVKGVVGVYSNRGTEISISGGSIEGTIGVQKVLANRTKISLNAVEITASNTCVEAHYADVTITNCDKLISTDFNSAGIKVFGETKFVMTDCTVESKGYYGITGNGTIKKTDGASDTYGALTDIKLTNCNISGMWGIYHPQYQGVMTVEDCSIVGSCVGIEVRAGKVTLNNTVVESLSNTFNIKSNNSGTTVEGGVAVAISQHNTDDKIVVTVNGSTLKGVYAIYEKDVQNASARDQISGSVDENSTLLGDVYSENVQAFKDLMSEQPEETAQVA